MARVHGRLQPLRIDSGIAARMGSGWRDLERPPPNHPEPLPGIDLAGGDAADVGLHHHAIQGLIDAAAGLEDRGKEAPGAKFGDQQVDVTGLGGQGARPVAVAVAEPVLAALMALRAEHGSDLQLDQLLQAVAHQLGDQFPCSAAIQ